MRRSKGKQERNAKPAVGVGLVWYATSSAFNFGKTSTGFDESFANEDASNDRLQGHLVSVLFLLQSISNLLFF